MFGAYAAGANRPAGLLQRTVADHAGTAGASDLETALDDVGNIAAAIAEAGISPRG